MNVYIENETGIRFNFRGYKKLIEEVVNTVEKEKNIPSGMEVNVTIVSAEDIKQINNETRGIDKVTDVLSFPYFEFDEPGVFDEEFLDDISENDTEEIIDDPEIQIYDGDEPELILGDIVLCAEKVMEQAESFGHSQKRELAFLVVHSMLHLIGYDHMNEADEKLMFGEADKLMNILGITRE